MPLEVRPSVCLGDTVNLVSLPGPPLFPSHGAAEVDRSVPQHLGSPDPTQGMGPSLPPRSSVASGFWFKARLSGKAVLGPQEQAADGGRSEFLTMGESVETWVGKQCGEGLPSSQLLASYIEKVGPAASGARRLFPVLPSCPCTWLACMFLYVQHTIGKTTQTASQRNCPCPSPQY